MLASAVVANGSVFHLIVAILGVLFLAAAGFNLPSGPTPRVTWFYLGILCWFLLYAFQF